ncbi:hypothetical protein CLPU_3c01520 [Gottschalkia purinilytica]|uniref:Uncharacterized protein n=1 Tax=Gottschalkia purinilytica TaxID=1503 RepID=A0A0L0WD17_GOTPU|nr:hypothetical protein CLPU_3c01520 [Gottschalkia purinilytica]
MNTLIYINTALSSIRNQNSKHLAPYFIIIGMFILVFTFNRLGRKKYK